MATITIKFKDELNYTSPIPSGDDDVTFNVTFICDNVTYSRIYINKDTISMSYDSSQIWDSRGWSNTKYQYITLDTNQTNFNAFITAMKDNIEGVLLESGTYVWNDVITLPTSISYYSFSLINFVSNNSNFTKISIDDSAMQYWIDSAPDIAYEVDNWYIDAYKTITTSEDQYINYDFYNYAILGNQLVKQGDTPTPTSYTITDSLSNVTASPSNVYQIDEGGTRSLTYTWSTQYVVGINNINVVNADYTPTFSGNSVTLALSNPSGNVTINISASEGDFEFNITSNGTTTLATENTYVEHDIVFKVNVPSTPTVEIQSALNMASGNQVITPDEGKTMSKVTIVKPTTFTAENIKKGVIIGYITGTYEGLIPDGTAVASNVRAGYTFYGNGTSKLTGTMQDYTGSTTIKSNGTMYSAGKYMPSNVVIDVPNPTLSGNAIASQVLKGQKFYSNSYTLLTGTMETYSGTYTITQNGTYSTSGKYLNSDIVVNVAGVTEVSTSTEMDNKLVQANVGQYYKYTGTTDEKYTNGDIYQVESDS